MNFSRHKRDPLLAEIRELRKETRAIMATVDEVQAALTTLTTDLEGLASTAQAEFTKLEKEVSEGSTQPNLDPLKEAIEAIDTKVKSAVVPTA